VARRRTKRPKGLKYRNLHIVGGSIYYERQVSGELFKFSCKTLDWDLAAEQKREFEDRTGIARGTLNHGQ